MNVYNFYAHAILSSVHVLFSVVRTHFVAHTKSKKKKKKPNLEFYGARKYESLIRWCGT